MGQDDSSAKTVLINKLASGSPPAAAGSAAGGALDHAASGAATSESGWVTPSAGDVLGAGRFRILDRIGEGGMGVVFEAFDEQRRAKVALKTLHRLEPAGIYQLKTEFRTLADVSHPNLVRLHELFASEDSCFFTMDLVDGLRLDEWFKGVRQSCEGREVANQEPAWAEQLRGVLAELVDAITAIHHCGKLHRDLKPSNVMVTRDARVVVLDFGLTITPGAGIRERYESPSELSGTPGYMSPEQALGLEASPASDWYALGVMLFQLLSGRLPFAGSFTEILVAKQLKDAPRLSHFAPNAPADLSGLCSELLAADPEQRPDAATLARRFGKPDSSRTGLASRPPSRPPQLLGRDAELESLRQAYSASTSQQQPVVLLLRGESGIGKSTLVTGFLGELSDTSQSVVLRGRCYERETIAFNAFDAVVDDLSSYLKTLPLQEAAKLVPREAWALVRLFPVLGRVPALSGAPPRPGADPHEIRRRGFVALGQLLRRIRYRAPLVLFIDDLHWSDADSITLLLHVLRQPDAPHVLFVGTRRDEPCAVLAPLYEKLPDDIRIDFREISVAPLAPQAALQLVGSDAPQGVLNEAHGNPFLLKELARHARERNPEGARAQSLNQVLWQRASELPDSAQRLLRAIALSQSSVPLAVVMAAANAHPSSIDPLQDRQLVRRAGREGEVECYHDKIREAVSLALPVDAAREMHRSLALAWQGSPTADPERLSLHYAEAGLRQRAAELSVQAAERAASAFGFERAVQLFDRALELGQFDPTTQHRLKLARADVLAQAGRSLEAAEACLTALDSAPNPAATEDLTRRVAGFYLQCGRIEQAIDFVNRGLAPYGLSLASSNAAAVASLLWERARLRLRGYRPSARPNARARESFQAAEMISSALPNLDPIRYPALATRMLRLALDSGDRTLVARGMASEILVGLMLAFPDARLREIARQAEAYSDQSADPVARFWLHVNLATLELNDHPRASLAHVDRAREVLTRHPSPTLSHLGVWLEWNRLQVLCLQGDFREVARSTPALLDDAWASDNRGVVPFLAGVPGAVARVAVEDLAGLRHDLDRSREAWQKDTFTWQDIMQTQGEVALASYTGELGRALFATQLLESKLERSLARRAASVRGYVGYVSAWTQLARARDLPAGSERQRLLDKATAALRHCHSTRLAASWSSPLEAAVQVLRGNTQAALASLEALLQDTTATERLPVYAVCARRGLGGLLGGSEGASLIAHADAFLRERGVVDPERFVRSVAPGLTPAGS